MLKRNGWLAVVLAAVFGLAAVAVGQDKSIVRIEPGRLMALVIGNAAYAEAPLTNPVNDARAVAGVLRGKLGFAEQNVELLENLASHEELTLAVEAFGERLRATDVAFFYYSGHGMAVNRENYLLPTGFGARGPVKDQLVPFRALGEQVVRAALEDAQLRVIVLDACRNNPYGTVKSAPPGLVPAGSAAEGELLAYATGEGQTATDLGEGTGVYARHLVAALQAPGVEIVQVFRTVAHKVAAETGRKQRPQYVDDLAGTEFYFVPGELGGEERLPQPEVVVVEPVPALTAAERWPQIAGTEDEASLEGFLRRYRGRDGAEFWTKLAEQRLERLREARARGREKAKREAKRREAEAALAHVLSTGNEAAASAFVDTYRAVAPDLARKAEELLGVGQVWRSPLRMEFAWIPAGRFVMGSPEGEEGRDGDEVQHEVRISEGFWMGKYEVTQGEWEAVMGSNPSYFESCGARCPVEHVSWEDVQGFIEKLNARESGNGNRYRLPTEAEWEYAARAGTTGARHGVLGSIAWYDDNSGDRTHPVGQKRANGWGLHDMLGNVWEWTGDWSGDYPSSTVTDPRGPSTGSARVARGGSWYTHARYVRSADRRNGSPGGRAGNFGFRLVRTK